MKNRLAISGMKLMELNITYTYGGHYFHEKKSEQILYKIENEKKLFIIK